jgi:hypothetical protein
MDFFIQETEAGTGRFVYREFHGMDEASLTAMLDKTIANYQFIDAQTYQMAMAGLNARI